MVWFCSRERRQLPEECFTPDEYSSQREPQWFAELGFTCNYLDVTKSCRESTFLKSKELSASSISVEINMKVIKKSAKKQLSIRKQSYGKGIDNIGN
ncbi:Hypothetical predicted protein [Mytilus galloprovincialis]|uniref:Uncharacterized protein n=1 Tax=Mytilus galloprovincialis TaxID=29158 RepID=A0A8B6CUC4_MYTGA|nr:Hypothetical predicted protein [Mytilus galloprovincialis]